MPTQRRCLRRRAPRASFRGVVALLNIKAGAAAVATGVADIAGGAANAIGKVANEAGKGLFSGFGTPLLVGAGLIGLFLISRSKRDSSGESQP